MRIKGTVFPLCTVERAPYRGKCYCQLTHETRAEASAATRMRWTDADGHAVCKCHDPIKGFPCDVWRAQNPAQTRFEFND